MQSIFAFIEFYVSPFFVAIALAFLLNGLINYFIIGNIGLEEDRREIGRQSLLWATLFLIIALLLYATSSWLLRLGDRIEAETGDTDVEVQRGGDVLNIPNVPGVR